MLARFSLVTLARCTITTRGKKTPALTMGLNLLHSPSCDRIIACTRPSAR